MGCWVEKTVGGFMSTIKHLLSTMDDEIKCVVWDLDETIWEGTLLESPSVVLKPDIHRIIQTLDERGILHSIASRNDYQAAILKLEEFGIRDYFLYPQISWDAKSVSLERISKKLNIALNAILFVDDQPFERDEVLHCHPEVCCVPAEDFASLPKLCRLNPRFVTDDSMRRRHMYRDDIMRNQDEADFQGPTADFLDSLKMRLQIAPATESDLQRAAELTHRTHQLNATGKTYDYDELNAYRLSPDHLLFICRLEDRYGSYGSIGLSLLETRDRYNHLRLLLMSCRVMSRGVGTIVLTYLMHLTKAQGKTLLADFKPTDRNRQMYVSYKFANFRENDSMRDGLILLENDLSYLPSLPHYVDVIVPQIHP